LIRFPIFLFPVLCAFTPRPAVAVDRPVIERWDRAVCLHTEQKKTDGRSAYATAFLVRKADSLFLITAAHAAQETHSQSKLLYRNAGGESKWIHIGALIDKPVDPWHALDNSDLSIMSILRQEGSVAPQIAELHELALDFDSLLQAVPRRTCAIDIGGFPIGLGSTPQISPLVMKGYLASRELEADAKWGKTPVIYALPIVGAGCSGAPVFVALDAPTEIRVVGMYIGLVYDPSGTKLSILVPSRLIRTAIKRELERNNAASDTAK